MASSFLTAPVSWYTVSPVQAALLGATTVSKRSVETWMVPLGARIIVTRTGSNCFKSKGQSFSLVMS